MVTLNTGYLEVNQDAHELIVELHFQHQELNMDNSLTPNTKVHSSSAAKIHSNLLVKPKSTITLFVVNQMVFGTLVTCAVKDQFAMIQVDQVMDIKLLAVTNKVQKFYSVVDDLDIFSSTLDQLPA